MNMSESDTAQGHRLWFFYDREGDFVTHDRFATSVEAEAFATERNLLPWMPPVSAIGLGDITEDDSVSRPAISWSSAGG